MQVERQGHVTRDTHIERLRCVRVLELEWAMTYTMCIMSELRVESVCMCKRRAGTLDAKHIDMLQQSISTCCSKGRGDTLQIKTPYNSTHPATEARTNQGAHQSPTLPAVSLTYSDTLVLTRMAKGVAVCYCVLPCVAVCCGVLLCVEVCCGVSQCVAVKDI